MDCLNLLNSYDNDISHFYESQAPGRAAANETHIRPIEPRMFRLRLTYRF